jgi:uncharacterized protein
MGQPVVHFEVIGKDGDRGSESGAASGPRQKDTTATSRFTSRSPMSKPRLAKAESLGGTRMMGPDKVPGVDIEIALFSDPEGHVIGLELCGRRRSGFR